MSATADSEPRYVLGVLNLRNGETKYGVWDREMRNWLDSTKDEEIAQKLVDAFNDSWEAVAEARQRAFAAARRSAPQEKDSRNG